MSKDEDLLREIREDYSYFSQRWANAREERRTDLRYIAGDPWSEKDRLARKDRPCINHDELGQYVNACVNNVRQNKRGIKASPEGYGADDETAERLQDLIRTIEYKSKAASIYCTAFQSMVEGGYAFFRISRRYVSQTDDSEDQEIVVKSIANPDSVLFDPDCKEPDWSDGRKCFVLDPMPIKEFTRRYPDAEKTSFSGDDRRVAGEWLQENSILVAEYWRIEEDERPKNKRKQGKQRVVQYITNGLEILEKNPQPGEILPIIPVIGLQRYIDDERVLFSLVRLARDPQMSLAYLCSQQMEEAGLTPKTPYVGYVGQFESDGDAWETVNKVPHSYLQADPMVDGATGTVLPLPRREQFTPNFAAYEIAKDSCRRAVQAAMGITPLPTAAQRSNQKSGVALEQITSQQELGSFHFTDSLDSSLQLSGRVIESWARVTYDTERDMGFNKANDSHEVQHLTGDEFSQGKHFITISTGPSASSQRESADNFLDNALIPNIAQLPIPPPSQAKLLSLSIRMKQLGPLGDEMADVISPPEDAEIPAQAQAAIAQAKQENQALFAYVQHLQQELQKAEQEKQAKVVDNQYKLAIEQMRQEVSLAVAEINTKAQQMSEREGFIQDIWKQLHSQAHEAGMQAEDQAHQQQQAQAAAQQASTQQASDQQFQAQQQAQQSQSEPSA